MNTDLTVTSGGDARIAAPVVKSASYNFVAGDVGAWLYIASGTNWTKGWYQISAVASNEATLSAAIGAGILSTGSKPSGATTAAGVATVQTPTGGTWTIDYSQQDAAEFAYTDLNALGAGLLLSSAEFPFGKQQVGNCIVITGGTNFNTGRYVIASIGALNVATVVGPTNVTSAAGTGGTGNQGGALATWAKAESFKVISNGVFIKSTSGYSISSGITLAATGNSLASVCPDWVIGYTNTRLDGGKVTITASATIAMVTLSINNFRIENITLDGADTATTCWLCTAANPERGMVLTDCGATRFATRGMNFNAGVGPTLIRPRVWDAKAGATSGILIIGGCVIDCEVNTPECDAITNEGANSSTLVFIGGAIYLTNTASVKKALNLVPLTTVVVHGMTLHTSNGDLITLTGSYQSIVALNNIIYGAGATGVGYGINGTYARPSFRSIDYNAFGNNTTGHRNNFNPGPNDVTLTGDPCTSAAGGDLSLDNTAGEGAACRATGTPGVFPGGGTTGYRSRGAVEPQAAGGSNRVPLVNGGLVQS